MIVEDISNTGTAFTITIGEELYLITYNKVIAKIVHDVVFLDEIYWNFSRTTAKYRNIFLLEDSKVTHKKLNDDIYKLANLNN
jgi:hypothetical protein